MYYKLLTSNSQFLTLHNMLYFFCENSKDFVKIMFDKMVFTLYNT